MEILSNMLLFDFMNTKYVLFDNRIPRGKLVFINWKCKWIFKHAEALPARCKNEKPTYSIKL